VLCLHGLTRNSRDFEDLARTCSIGIASSFGSARPRPVGSGYEFANYQPAIYVQDIIALLDTVGAPQVTVIGTSLGGLLAMMLGLATEPASPASC